MEPSTFAGVGPTAVGLQKGVRELLMMSVAMQKGDGGAAAGRDGVSDQMDQRK